MHFHVFLWLHRCWTGAFPVWPQEVLALLWGLWEEAGCLHFSFALSSVLHFPFSLHVNYLFCSYCDGERKEGTSTSFLSFNLTNRSIRDVYICFVVFPEIPARACTQIITIWPAPPKKPAPQPLLCAASSPGSRLRKAALKRLAPAPLKLWLKLRESFNRLLLVPAVGREGRSPPQWMQQQQFVVNQSNDDKSESQGSLQPAGAAWYRATFHDFIIGPFAVTILAMQQKGDDHQTALIQEVWCHCS